MSGSGIRAIYLRERPKLLRMLVARLGDKEAAEDILETLWYRLQEEASGPVSGPGAYLMRYANRLAIERRRALLWDSMREGHPPDGVPARERTAQVTAAIEALPERVGRAFRLHRLDGLSLKEIARIMDIRPKLAGEFLQQAYRAIHDRGRESDAETGGRRRLSSKEDSA